MKLSYEDKIKIYRLRQSGWTWPKISQTFNISKYNLQYMVRLLRDEARLKEQQKSFKD